MAQRVKHLPTMWKTRVRSLGQEYPLEKEMATHTSTLAWKIHVLRSLVVYSPWGRKEPDTMERLHFHFPRMTVAVTKELPTARLLKGFREKGLS